MDGSKLMESRASNLCDPSLDWSTAGSCTFIELGISDIWLPFSVKTLPECLKRPSVRDVFVKLQHVVLTKAFDLEREDGKHRHFLDENEIPLRTIRFLRG